MKKTASFASSRLPLLLSLPRSLCLALLLFAALAAVPALAVAADEDARAQAERGKAAYALGHFAEAAEAYEASFKLAPSPALLYNAAQSHRLAAHKERALELYQSYLRVYGRSGKNREEAEKHIANLTRAVEEDHRAATAPPTTMATEGVPDVPSGAAGGGTAVAAGPGGAAAGVAATSPPAAPGAPPPAPLPAATAPAAAPATLVSAPGSRDSDDDRPLTSRPWFWIAIGGAVVAAAVVTIVAVSGGSSPPSPTGGTISGN